MKSIKILNLNNRIFFRKVLLNFLLLNISPTNKLVVIISQNLDKHIVFYQKELFEQHRLKTLTTVVPNRDFFFNYVI